MADKNTVEAEIAKHQKEIERLNALLTTDVALVEEYRALVQAHKSDIIEAEKEAIAALDRAITLCEKYGISHDFSLSPICQTYAPTSFGSSKFGALRNRLREEGLLDYYEFDGWQHSAVCW